ncbi:hypothetical protein [Streptacidiphilus jiangxiensis]|uniref:Uncharacterized protein n=1 Tax=Streptacidiphilus jiangxiensis TaxID=235985 RepID=A0A1H7YVY8_STRJI|nr:hypothetical protein [Streptacidiphilus jiangxiensis]SEM50402.1 hypothetical protein SAMN05414137_13124 [Streptacidiphilus jiangxiensis]
MGFRRIWAELKEGKDVDVYVTICLAVTVSVLSFLDVISLARVSSLLLAVLAVLAYNILATRSAVEREARAPRGPELHDDFPEDLKQRRADSDDVYLIGVNLARTIETSYPAFETILRRGGRIRLLLTDVDADEAALTTQGQASRPAPEDIRNDIRQSLGKLRALAASTADAAGRLDVRTTRVALKFGANYLDAGRPGARLYVQLYSFRIPGESRPMFRLTHADGAWFECFALQAEALWEEAAACELLPPPIGVAGAEA